MARLRLSPETEIAGDRGTDKKRGRSSFALSVSTSPREIESLGGSVWIRWTSDYTDSRMLVFLFQFVPGFRLFYGFYGVDDISKVRFFSSEWDEVFGLEMDAE